MNLSQKPKYILTFDVEEWFLNKTFGGDNPERYRLCDSILDWLLVLLEKHGIKATFFCVGELAAQFPDVVQRIAEKGHEIGCHSNRHRWVNKMTQDEFRDDLSTAIRSIEKVSGQKIKYFRAPAFSVGLNNLWAFSVMSECGIECDCSVFPANRDFGGFPQFKSLKPAIIKHKNGTLRELPISLTTIFGKKIAFSGGGYFRFFPLSLQRYFLKKMDYVMFYFHINDLIVEKNGLMSRERYETYFKEKGTLKNRIVRYLKSNVGRGNAKKKLEILLREFEFCSVGQAVNSINWDQQNVINL